MKLILRNSLIITGLLTVLYFGCKPKTQQPETTEPVKAETIIIIDMAGRVVEVPADIDSVFSRCPMGTILMYTLNPEKIAGLSWKPTEYEKEFLTKDYCSLPVLSGWFATNEGNVEEIIRTAPDIMFSSTENPEKNTAAKEQADKLQSLLNIPVVIISAGIENIPAIYRFAGKLINEEERAEVLAAYTEDMLAEVKGIADTIPEEKKVGIYYAEGVEGLHTDPSGSRHSELIDFIGAVNVADVEMIIGVGGMGRTQVSPEQLLAWNPNMIIACHDQGFANNAGTYTAVLSDSRFETLDAVSGGKVFEIPYIPFNVTDRPPSVNRIIGVKWLANLVYPEYYNYNMEKEFREFYKLFYNIDLTDEQLTIILANAR